MGAVLVACEESQEVCKAFRARGHDAFSCDIQPCSGGHPEWHIQGDALEVLDYGWDLLIAHPPCTYMSNAGARWMYPVAGSIDEERYRKAMEAKEFFMQFLDANVPMIAVENPRPMKIVGLPEPSQTIQPYNFGDPYSKATHL
jgi:site-specific DNA-cytosine methylase